MYRAEHEKMYQEANQGLIEIRKQEIDYFMRVNSAIGTQSALIIGFVYLTFSQNLDGDYVYTQYFNAIYYVFSAITMALCTNIILCTMLVQLLGPGLALNGPIGSMAKATEGMKIEQTQIMTSFFLMMISFSITTVLLFWVTMDFYSAVVSTFFFLVAARYWIFFCSRIYHRFYWDRAEAAKVGIWNDRGRESSEEPMVQMRVSNQANNPIHRDLEAGPLSEHHNAERNSIFSTNGSKPSSGPRPSFSGAMERVSNMVGSISGKPSTSNNGSNKDSGKSNGNSSAIQRPSMVNPKDTLVEGYITMNLVSELKAKHWERRYVVLNYRGQLTYYKNRQDFRTDPTASRLNPRPLELDEYFITFSKQEHVDDNSTLSSANQNGDVDGLRVKFIFNLTRKDDPAYTAWHYRSDTEEELDMWVAAMKVVSPTSFKTETIV